MSQIHCQASRFLTSIGVCHAALIHPVLLFISDSLNVAADILLLIRLHISVIHKKDSKGLSQNFKRQSLALKSKVDYEMMKHRVSLKTNERSDATLVVKGWGEASLYTTDFLSCYILSFASCIVSSSQNGKINEGHVLRCCSIAPSLVAALSTWFQSCKRFFSLLLREGCSLFSSASYDNSLLCPLRTLWARGGGRGGVTRCSDFLLLLTLPLVHSQYTVSLLL